MAGLLSGIKAAKRGLLGAVEDASPGIGHNMGPRFTQRDLDPMWSIERPAGADPRYLGAAPDRSPGDYARYIPARGLPERMARLTSIVNDRSLPIHQMLDDYIRRGVGLGGPDWYNTEELRDWFIAVLGKDAGDARWREYVDLIGNTSTGSNVPSNFRNASFYATLNPTDRLAVADLVAGGGITPADAARRLGIDVPNMPDNYNYGHVMQANQGANVANSLRGTWDRTVPEGLSGAALSDWLKANPKVKGFANDLLGNRKNIAADKHFMRLLAMADGGLDFLSGQAQISGENLARLRDVFGDSLDPYTKVRRTGTGQRITEVNLAKAVNDGVVTDATAFKSIPQAWTDTPKANEYDALEDMAARLAANYDMTPAQFQASLWMGAGDLTGLADESQGIAMELIRRTLDRRAGELGVDRRKMFEMFARGEAPLAIAPVAGGLLGSAMYGGDIESYLREIEGR
jgi:hypothetical protein